MKILVHGDNTKKFFNMDSIREPYYANVKHDKNNIDFLRPWYCELTALYYVLNNYTDDIIGLEQYRRYILKNDLSKPIDEIEISNILQNYDVICGKEHYPNGNGAYIFTWPIRNGLKDRFLVFIDTIKQMYGNEMADHFNKFLYGQWHCHGNLMIGKRTIIKEYFEWLCNTFVEYNKKIKLDNNSYRTNEYLSEFFFGAWLTYNNYKIYFSHWMNCGRIIE